MNPPDWLSTMAYVVRWGEQSRKTDGIIGINGVTMDGIAHVTLAMEGLKAL